MSRFLITTTTSLSPFGKIGVWMLLIGAIVTPVAFIWLTAVAMGFMAVGYDPQIGPWMQLALFAISMLALAGGFVLVLVERDHRHEVTVLSDEQ